jgi:DNA polymerase III subunit epsilon
VKILFFDTETTGLPIWKEPSDDLGQPHIVDIACELWDGDTCIESYESLVDIGAPIPPEMTDIHGITDEMVQVDGNEPDVVLTNVMALIKQADILAGHNISFDIRMLRIMAARVSGEKWENLLPTFCTMRKSTNIVKAIGPKARHPQDWKWPTLGEAHTHFFGEVHSDAHRAMTDCIAARKVYFEIMKAEKLA